MKIYITKPKHSKYGSIKLENPFNSIEELIDNSIVWFYKPAFEKPFMDIFGEGFVWRWWISKYSSSIPLKYFPESEVKDNLRKLVLDSISPDFYESLHNRHYKWIGELDVDLIRKETIGNLTLYLTKPCVWSIKVAGIDRAKIWFTKPVLKKYDNELSKEDLFLLDGLHYIDGKFFRKVDEHEDLCSDMWNSIINSFDVSYDNFYSEITENNHKAGQSSNEFVKEYYFDILIKNDENKKGA